MQIEDGATGRVARVDARNHLSVSSIGRSQQHAVSHDDGRTFQFIGDAKEFNGVASVLWIENTSSTRDLVVSFIRLQAIGTSATALATNDSKYFTLRHTSSSRAGGALITPVNMNLKSGLTADATAYSGNTAMTSTNGTEFDRWYPDGTMETFNKQGSLIIGKGGIIEVTFTSGEVQGATAYARVTGYYIDASE